MSYVILRTIECLLLSHREHKKNHGQLQGLRVKANSRANRRYTYHTDEKFEDGKILAEIALLRFPTH